MIAIEYIVKQKLRKMNAEESHQVAAVHESEPRARDLVWPKREENLGLQLGKIDTSA